MIINFSVQNFGSIKEKQTLSFEADESTHLEDAYIIREKDHRILKLALIYGANASGKTTILQALDFLRRLVLEPEQKKTSELNFNPFLFDTHTPHENSVFSIEFSQSTVTYLYEIEFCKQAIISENLYYFNSKKTNIFKRKTNVQKQLTEITFDGKITIDPVYKKTLEANTLWNNTVLGGYIKTNIDYATLQEIIEWFELYLQPMIYTRTELEKFISTRISNNSISKENIIAMLQKADMQVSDIIIQEEKRQIAEGDALKDVTFIKTAFEHTVDTKVYTLPIEFESQGTRRYYGFAGLLALLISHSIAFPIDELESSLHPDLYIHFILSFLLNSHNSQIIATTHNREMLGNKDIFRNDAIWFTNKQDDSATELYSLADFDNSAVSNTTNILNAYKSGKLSATPNLGDNFID